MQFTEETKHQYFGGNSTLEPWKQEQHRLAWFSSNILIEKTCYWGIVRLSDTEYLRFLVPLLLRAQEEPATYFARHISILEEICSAKIDR